MLKDRIRFVSAQPDELHFVWQTHVYLENYAALGIPARNSVALFGTKPGAEPSPALRRLRERFPEADVRVYEDTRDAAGRGYPPSIQPHLIGKALEETPEWEGELTFFQDCDIVFRRLPDFERMVREHPRACLLSDTRDYIGFEHLTSRCKKIDDEKPGLPPNELIHRMCEVVGVDFDVVRRNELHSGGAQYLLQGVGRPYWAKVYRDSIALRRLFDDYLGGLGLSKEPKEYVQVWTAGMWAYLWNLWLAGHETVLHPELKFLWAGTSSKTEGTIIHMAGLQDALKPSHLDKQDWWEQSPIDVLPRQPYLLDHLPEGSASHEYGVWIHRAAGVPLRRAERLAPARFWRLLAWKTEARSEIWDVDHVGFRFEGGASIARAIASGEAGPGFGPANALDADGRFWGGRPEKRDGCAPCLWWGIELDRPALPEKITLTQHEGPHTARLVLVQWSDEGETWRTAHAALASPQLAGQTILYRSEAGHCARGWRIATARTSSGFAWDVRQLRFLRDAKPEHGQPIASGDARPDDPKQYGAANAFDDDVSYWGGRPDASGRFHLGLDGASGLAVNRVVIDQGEDHFATHVEIEVLDERGRWTLFREAENLGPGLNDVLLFEVAAPAPWVPPRLVPKPDTP